MWRLGRDGALRPRRLTDRRSPAAAARRRYHWRGCRSAATLPDSNETTAVAGPARRGHGGDNLVGVLSDAPYFEPRGRVVIAKRNARAASRSRFQPFTRPMAPDGSLPAVERAGRAGVSRQTAVESSHGRTSGGDRGRDWIGRHERRLCRADLDRRERLEMGRGIPLRRRPRQGRKVGGIVETALVRRGHRRETGDARLPGSQDRHRNGRDRETVERLVWAMVSLHE